MRGSFAGLLAALVALAAGGVRAETELVVAAYPPLDESVKLAIPRFERLHPGVEVKLVSRAFGDHHNAMITALGSGKDVPDVVGIDVSFIGQIGAGNTLEDLIRQPYLGKPLLEKLLGFTRSHAVSPWGRLVAIPADIGPGTLFYRKDLLDEAGVSERELTRSWESYLEAGKKIKAATGAYLLPHAVEMMDVFLEAGLKDRESVYYGRKEDPLVRTSRFRRAFELAKRAREAQLDARIGAWSSEWAEGLRNGTIATVMSGAWLSDHLNNWIAPGTKGSWRAAQLPGGGWMAWGGSFYAIPRNAAHKPEGWEFIKLLCFDRTQQVAAWKAAGAWPALRSAQDDPFVDEPVLFLGGQQARRIWRKAAARIPTIMVSRLDPVGQGVINAELEQVLEKDKDIDQALTDAVQDMWAPHGGWRIKGW